MPVEECVDLDISNRNQENVGRAKDLGYNLERVVERKKNKASI